MAKKRPKKKSHPTTAKTAMMYYQSPVPRDSGMAYVAEQAAMVHEQGLLTPTDNKLMRLLAAKADAISDSDYLELVLAPVAPVKDTHHLAIRLLERFGTLKQVIYADRGEIKRILPEHADAICHTFQMIQIGAIRLLRNEIFSKPIIHSWFRLLDYLKLSSGQQTIEEFRVLYLNHRHELILDEVLQRGTVNHTPVYPREVVKRGLELSAAALILVHNHPSNDPQPSKSDIDITWQIIQAAAAVGITVHDHVIVTQSNHYSFKSFGLLGEPTVTEPAILPEGHQYSFIALL